MTTWDWTSEQWRFLSLCFNSPFPHSWPLPFSKPRSLHGTNACACFLFALLVMCVRKIWWGNRTPHCPFTPFTRPSRLPVFRIFLWWHQRVFGDWTSGRTYSRDFGQMHFSGITKLSTQCLCLRCSLCLEYTVFPCFLCPWDSSRCWLLQGASLDHL